MLHLIEGSELDYLISDPLPVTFQVSKDKPTKVSVEVISAAMGEPENYEYTTFGLNILKTFNFMISVFGYNSISNDFELLDAIISLSSNGDLLMKKELDDSTNNILVRAGLPEYKLSFSQTGYLNNEAIMSEKELKKYTTTSSSNCFISR